MLKRLASALALLAALVALAPPARGDTLPAKTNTDMGGFKVKDMAQGTASGEAVAAQRTITAGTGLTGGGDLTADRTLSVDSSLIPSGSGTSGRVTIWTGTNTVGSDAALLFSTSNHRLTVGTSATTTGQVELMTSGGSHYTRLQASGSAAADATYTFPTGPPASDGYALTSLTTGVTSWTSVLTPSTGAPIGSAFVTIGSDATLTAERALTQGTGITITDGGANSTVTVALTAPVTVALGGTNCTSASGTCLDNVTGFASTGIVQRTGAGTYAFLGAGTGITISGGNVVNSGVTSIAVGTSGSDFAASASTGAVTLNLPSMAASAVTRGILTNGTQTLPGAKTLTSALSINLNTGSLPSALTGAVLQAANVDSTATVFDLEAAAAQTTIAGRRSQGTLASPSALAADNVVLGLEAWGYQSGGAYSTGARAKLTLNAAEAWTSSAQGTYATVYTTPTGSTTAAEIWRWGPGGDAYTMGNNSPAALATGATAGFLHLTSMAGNPSGSFTPPTGRVPLVIDSTNKQLWANIAGTWDQLTFAGGGGLTGSGSSGRLALWSGSSTLTSDAGFLWSTTGPKLTLSGTAPVFVMTDTTASAKSLTVTTDANAVTFAESASASTPILGIDLANGRVGVGTAPTQLFHIAANTNGAAQIFFKNSSGGTGASTWINLNSDAAGNDAVFQLLSSGFTTSGSAKASGVRVGGGGSGGLSVEANNAAGVIRFYTGGTADANLRMQITSGGLVGIGGTPTDQFDVINNQNAATYATVQNNSGGASAIAAFQMSNGTHSLNLEYQGSGYSSSGLVQADGGAIGMDGAGGLSIYAHNAAGVLRFGTAGSAAANERLRIDANGNLFMGGNNSPAALATSATNGFTFIQNMAGKPTGAPTLPTGRSPCVWDSSNHELWCEDGSTWYGLAGATGAGSGITGSGASPNLAYWTGTSTVSNAANLYWDSSNNRLGIGSGASSPTVPLQVKVSSNASTSINVANATSGTAAQAAVNLNNDASGAGIQFYSTGFTTNGASVAGGVDFFGDGSGGVSIECGHSTGGVLRVYTGGSATGNLRHQIDVNGNTTLTPGVQTSGSPIGFLYTGAAHTTLAASTESIDFKINANRTVQFATGAITTQRTAFIDSATYGFVGASTITNAATLAIAGAPTAGTNATITNPFALWTQNGLNYFQYRDSGTNTAVETNRYEHESSGTAAAGFGLYSRHQLQNASGTIKEAGRQTWSWTIATASHETSKWELGLSADGGAGTAFTVGPFSVASAASATLDAFLFPAASPVITGTTHVTTVTGLNYVTINAPTYTDSSAVTVDLGATLYVAGMPAAGGAGPVTLTHGYGLWVGNANGVTSVPQVRIDGGVTNPPNPQALSADIIAGGGAGNGPASQYAQHWLPVNVDGAVYFMPLFQ